MVYIDYNVLVLLLCVIFTLKLDLCPSYYARTSNKLGTAIRYNLFALYVIAIDRQEMILHSFSLVAILGQFQVCFLVGSTGLGHEETFFER